MNNGIRTLVSLGQVARIVIGIFIAGCVLTILIQLLGIFAGELLLSSPDLFAIGTLGASGIQVIAFLASVVVTAIWVYRAHANLHAAGLGGLNYSPAWATASFFIPFVNVYVPFVSTRELYNRSHGESDWHAASEAAPVTSWVACNWGAIVVFSALVTYLVVDSLPGVFVILPTWAWLGLSVLFYILLSGSACFLFQLVSRITSAQEAGLHLSQSDVFA